MPDPRQRPERRGADGPDADRHRGRRVSSHTSTGSSGSRRRSRSTSSSRAPRAASTRRWPDRPTSDADRLSDDAAPAAAGRRAGPARAGPLPRATPPSSSPPAGSRSRAPSPQGGDRGRHRRRAGGLGRRPQRPDFVSRGGHKLAGALAAFGPLGARRSRGRRCLDAGASTGGFTDVLLRAGAARGGRRGRRLRPARVVAAPGRPRAWCTTAPTSASSTPDCIGGPVDLVVGDLSFISLTPGARRAARGRRAGRRPGADGQAAVRGRQGAGRQGRGGARPGAARRRRGARRRGGRAPAAGAPRASRRARCPARRATSSSSCGCAAAPPRSTRRHRAEVAAARRRTPSWGRRLRGWGRDRTSRTHRRRTPAGAARRAHPAADGARDGAGSSARRCRATASLVRLLDEEAAELGLGRPRALEVVPPDADADRRTASSSSSSAVTARSCGPPSSPATSGTPLLGVNLGHVGFLAEADPEDVEHTIERDRGPSLHAEERLTIDVAVYRDGDSWSCLDLGAQRGQRREGRPRADARGGRRGRRPAAVALGVRRGRLRDADRLDGVQLLRRWPDRLARASRRC